VDGTTDGIVADLGVRVVRGPVCGPALRSGRTTGDSRGTHVRVIVSV